MDEREFKSLSLVVSSSDTPDVLLPRLINGTVVGLHKLLGRPVDNWADPIGRIGKLALGCDQPWQRFARRWEAERLGLLAQDLRQLQTHNPVVFKAFRRTYRKLTINEFFGWRHELRVAADFTARRIQFGKQEAPDFRIEPADGNGLLFIECGSVNLAEAKDRDVSYKLRAVVDAKAAKPYANKRTALFLDYTNVLFSSVFGAEVLSAEAANIAVRSAFAASPFGAIVALALVVDPTGNRFTMVGMSETASDAAPDLASFIQQYAPNGPAQEVSFVPVFSI